MRPFDLLQPATVDEALSLVANHEDATIIAGGVMLTILLQQRLLSPRYLVSVSDLPQLNGVSAMPEVGLQMGASTTLRTLERHELVRSTHPVLADALRLVGNVRVRNMATVGGHLAHADPHLDLPPVLIALGANVSTRAGNGGRRILVDELITGYHETSLRPGEIIVSINVPAPPPSLTGVYLKYCSLSPNDWPTVGVAAFVRPEDGRLAEARVVAGSVSDRPLRVPEAESLLHGKRPNRAAIAEVARRYARAADPIDDVRGSADYKRRVTEVYVRRALEVAISRAGVEVVD